MPADHGATSPRWPPATPRSTATWRAATTRSRISTRPGSSRHAGGATPHHRPWMLGPPGEVIPARVIEKPPSAELAPGQRDDDSLPPYPVLDGILEMLVDGDRSVGGLRGRRVRAGHREGGRAAGLRERVEALSVGAGRASDRARVSGSTGAIPSSTVGATPRASAAPGRRAPDGRRGTPPRTPDRTVMRELEAAAAWPGQGRGPAPAPPGYFGQDEGAGRMPLVLP